MLTAAVVFFGLVGTACAGVAVASGVYGIGAALHGDWGGVLKAAGMNVLGSLGFFGAFLFNGWMISRFNIKA